MQEQEFSYTFYNLTKGERLALFCYPPDIPGPIPQAGLSAGSLVNASDTAFLKLQSRGFCTAQGKLTQRGMNFVAQVGSYRGRGLPWPDIKNACGSVPPLRWDHKNLDALYRTLLAAFRPVLADDDHNNPTLPCLLIDHDCIVGTDGFILVHIAHAVATETPLLLKPGASPGTFSVIKSAAYGGASYPDYKVYLRQDRIGEKVCSYKDIVASEFLLAVEHIRNVDPVNQDRKIAVGGYRVAPVTLYNGLTCLHDLGAYAIAIEAPVDPNSKRVTLSITGSVGDVEVTLLVSRHRGAPLSTDFNLSDFSYIPASTRGFLGLV